MAKQPNLIIICPDELRADCLGYMGNADIKTPNIDALAQASCVFPTHLASFPKCVSARISLMTGRYCHADGVRTIFQRMKTGTPNLLSRFRENNYETAFFGKNHCWSVEDRKRYFDYSSKESPYVEWMEKVVSIRTSNPSPDGPQPMDLPAGYDYIGCHTRHSGDEVFVDQSCDFLHHRRDRERPFFLQVNLESPHPYYGVEEPWYSMYDRESLKPWPHDLPVKGPEVLLRQREIRTSMDPDESALREIQAVYYGMISKVDHQVGLILDAVRDEGLWENTIIMFLSDHGDYAGQYGLIEKWDTSFSDCIVRVPMTIRGPGLPEGQVINSLSDHTNVAPTLLELMELAPLTGVHGASLVPVINGQKRIDVAFSEGGHEQEMRDRFDPCKSSPSRVSDPSRPLDAKQIVYQKYPETMARAVMARSDQYKVVVRENGDNEFYDLKKDPWELDNRWDDPSILRERSELILALAEWQLRTSHEGPFEEFFGS